MAPRGDLPRDAWQCQYGSVPIKRPKDWRSLSVFGPREDLCRLAFSCCLELSRAHAFPHPYSHTCTFLPFLALLMRWVVGVYVMGTPSLSTSPESLAPGEVDGRMGDMLLELFKNGEAEAVPTLCDRPLPEWGNRKSSGVWTENTENEGGAVAADRGEKGE